MQLTIRRSVLVLGPALFVLGQGAHAQQTASVAESLEQRRVRYAAAVDAYLEPMVESNLFSGAVLLAERDQVLVHRAYGTADIEKSVPFATRTRTKLMSVSKSLTAVGVMTLVDDGKLALHDTLGKHLEACPPAWRERTLRTLLSHCSRIPNSEVLWSGTAWGTPKRGKALWALIAAELETSQLTDQPEGRAQYSNFNYELLGVVIESVTQQPFQEFMQEAVFDAAGMKHTGYANGGREEDLSIGYLRGPNGTLTVSEQDMSRIQAAGGVSSTVGDLYALDRALIAGRVLKPETYAKMVTQASDWFACGWNIRPIQKRRCISHSGGSNGYVADFLRFPDDDVCIAVTSNYAFTQVTDVSNDLAAILFGEPYRMSSTPEGALLDAAEGVYRTADSRTGPTIVVRRSGGTLMAFEVHSDAEFTFANLCRPVQGGAFVMPHRAGDLIFPKAEDGRCPSLTLARPMENVSYERVPVAALDWTNAIGSYGRDEVPHSGMSIEQDDSGWRVVLDSSQEPVKPIVRLSETLGLVLWGATHGIPIQLQRSDGGQVTSATWRPPSGINVGGPKRR